jgi:PleD family two-component response regulator
MFDRPRHLTCCGGFGRNERMKQEDTVVYVVDDDAFLRGAIDSLLRSAGWRVQTFVSARDFLD